MKILVLCTLVASTVALRGSIPLTSHGNSVHLFKPTRDHSRRLVSENSNPSFSVNGDLWVSSRLGIYGYPDVKEALDTLQTNVDAEAQTRGNADTALGARIDTEVTERLQNASDLDAAMKAETTARIAGDNAEAQTRGNADTALGARIDTEVAERLQNASDLDAAMKAETTARIAGDNAEAQTRGNADTALGARIDTEVAERLQNASDLDAAIKAETTARIAGDNAEAQTRGNADTALGARIDTEVAERLQNASDLDAAIKAETTARIAGDNAEAQTRGNADIVLQGNIDTETQTRNASDVAIRADLAAEIQTRNASDVAIRAELAALVDEGAVQVNGDQSIHDKKTFRGDVQLGDDDNDEIEIRGHVTFSEHAPTPEFDTGIIVDGDTALTGKVTINKDDTNGQDEGFVSNIPAYFSQRAYVMPVDSTAKMTLSLADDPDFTEFDLEVYKPLLSDNKIYCDTGLIDGVHFEDGNPQSIDCDNLTDENMNLIHGVVRRAQIASVGYLEDHGRDEMMFALKVLYNTLGLTTAQFDSVLAAYNAAKSNISGVDGQHPSGTANQLGESTELKFARASIGVNCNVNADGSAMVAGSCEPGCVDDGAGCAPSNELFQN